MQRTNTAPNSKEEISAIQQADNNLQESSIEKRYSASQLKEDIKEYASMEKRYSTYLEENRQALSDSDQFAIDVRIKKIRTLIALIKTGPRIISYNDDMLLREIEAKNKQYAAEHHLAILLLKQTIQLWNNEPPFSLSSNLFGTINVSSPITEEYDALLTPKIIPTFTARQKKMAIAFVERATEAIKDERLKTARAYLGPSLVEPRNEFNQQIGFLRETMALLQAKLYITTAAHDFLLNHLIQRTNALNEHTFNTNDGNNLAKLFIERPTQLEAEHIKILRDKQLFAGKNGLEPKSEKEKRALAFAARLEPEEQALILRNFESRLQINTENGFWNIIKTFFSAPSREKAIEAQWRDVLINMHLIDQLTRMTDHDLQKNIKFRHTLRTFIEFDVLTEKDLEASISEIREKLIKKYYLPALGTIVRSVNIAADFTTTHLKENTESIIDKATEEAMANLVIAIKEKLKIEFPKKSDMEIETHALNIKNIIKKRLEEFASKMKTTTAQEFTDNTEHPIQAALYKLHTDAKAVMLDIMKTKKAIKTARTTYDEKTKKAMDEFSILAKEIELDSNTKEAILACNIGEMPLDELTLTAKDVEELESKKNQQTEKKPEKNKLEMFATAKLPRSRPLSSTALTTIQSANNSLAPAQATTNTFLPNNPSVALLQGIISLLIRQCNNQKSYHGEVALVLTIMKKGQHQVELQSLLDHATSLAPADTDKLISTLWKIVVTFFTQQYLLGKTDKPTLDQVKNHEEEFNNSVVRNTYFQQVHINRIAALMELLPCSLGNTYTIPSSSNRAATLLLSLFAPAIERVRELSTSSNESIQRLNSPEGQIPLLQRG